MKHEQKYEVSCSEVHKLIQNDLILLLMLRHAHLRRQTYKRSKSPSVLVFWLGRETIKWKVDLHENTYFESNAMLVPLHVYLLNGHPELSLVLSFTEKKTFAP